MGLFKEKKALKKSEIRMASTGSRKEISPLRPTYGEKNPPCRISCPSGNDIRGWLTVIAQREKTGLSLEQASDQAWYIEVETNPFPAVMGRIATWATGGSKENSSFRNWMKAGPMKKKLP